MADTTVDDYLLGLPESEQATVRALMHYRDSDAGRFNFLTIAEQRTLTHEAAVNAAMAYCADPDADREEPLRPFYALGHLNHTRDLPTYALMVVNAGVLDRDNTHALLAVAWTMPEYPEAGDTDLWRHTFRLTGWVCPDETPKPAEPMTLYRGAWPKWKRGMAWSADRERAEWFATRFESTKGRLYTADVHPDRMLAHFTGRHEDEYVIDTTRLPIRTIDRSKP